MNKLLLVALIGVVGAGLIAGLMVVGGPGYALKEKNDRERLQKLRRFGEYQTCMLSLANAAKDCAGLAGAENPVDPATGQAMTFEQVAEDQFKVCAVFQTDPKSFVQARYRQIAFDGQTGCLTYKRDASSGDWKRF